MCIVKIAFAVVLSYLKHFYFESNTEASDAVSDSK